MENGTFFLLSSFKTDSVPGGNLKPMCKLKPIDCNFQNMKNKQVDQNT